jgi:hypothetical protein
MKTADGPCVLFSALAAPVLDGRLRHAEVLATSAVSSSRSRPPQGTGRSGVGAMLGRCRVFDAGVAALPSRRRLRATVRACAIRRLGTKTFSKPVDYRESLARGQPSTARAQRGRRGR